MGGRRGRRGRKALAERQTRQRRGGPRIRSCGNGEASHGGASIFCSFRLPIVALHPSCLTSPNSPEPLVCSAYCLVSLALAALVLKRF